MIKSVAKDIAEIQYLPTFRFMGYDSEGLAKVIYWYENKEKKMTREEAMLKIRKANIGPEVAEVNLRILEALGLIKFDEPSPIERETIKLSKFADDIGYMGSINGLLGLAEKHGLSIKEDNPK